MLKGIVGNPENAKKAAQELAKRLEDIEVLFKTKVGKEGKMFGNFVFVLPYR